MFLQASSFIHVIISEAITMRLAECLALQFSWGDACVEVVVGLRKLRIACTALLKHVFDKLVRGGAFNISTRVTSCTAFMSFQASSCDLAVASSHTLRCLLECASEVFFRVQAPSFTL